MTIQLVKIGDDIWDPDGLDPDADLDYEIDLTDWLAQEQDTLQAMPAGLTVSGKNCTAYNPLIISGVKVRGSVKLAVPSENAAITFHWLTSAGRKEDRSIYFRVRDK